MTTRFTRSKARAATILAIVAFGRILSAAAAEPAATMSSPAIPTQDAAREQMALKIAGLVVFVANSCPGLKPDYARFKTIIGDLGMSEQKLAQPEVKNRYLAYTAAYQADASASCRRANAQFGPKGSTLPALFASR